MHAAAWSAVEPAGVAMAARAPSGAPTGMETASQGIARGLLGACQSTLVSLLVLLEFELPLDANLSRVLQLGLSRPPWWL